jgi:hypothetical protein
MPLEVVLAGMERAVAANGGILRDKHSCGVEDGPLCAGEVSAGQYPATSKEQFAVEMLQSGGFEITSYDCNSVLSNNSKAVLRFTQGGSASGFHRNRIVALRTNR